MGLKSPLNSSVIPSSNNNSNNSTFFTKYSTDQTAVDQEPSTYVTSFAKANLKMPPNSQQQQQQQQQQQVYRTELTITPTRKPGNNSPIVVPQKRN